ncbi:glycosyl transferase family 28 [Kocuria sediminis]|uniref:Glycosyl transferase family 28 n=1 Tax=Kocuria sediminis TaxID=1038857 RepID=A0A6N8GHS5_9MICC|nr:glycosyl transferase family 28 [Kocuria sediminis]MUN62279.1 glycosyl transferase family 28 [Kocuria sediminis]
MHDDELRLVLYSHDRGGQGHARRNLALAGALARQLPVLTGRRTTGVLLTGVDVAASRAWPAGFDQVVLPGSGQDTDGRVPAAPAVPAARVRSEMVDAVLTDVRPHLVVVDGRPWGPDQELLEPLLRLRAGSPGTVVVLGLPEVLGESWAAAREWIAPEDLGLLQEAYDQIWVYGDPAVHDPLSTGEIPAALAGRVRCTGYLAEGRDPRRRTAGDDAPHVLTLAGAGPEGHRLALTAARTRVPHGHRHVLVTGPQMPEEHAAQVRAAAVPGTLVLPVLPDALAEVADAAAVVSSGGYTSVAKILGTHAPALVVPQAGAGPEQLIRARALQGHGAVDVLTADSLTGAAIGGWLHRVVGTVRPREHLSLDGLRVAPALAACLLPGPGAEDGAELALAGLSA